MKNNDFRWFPLNEGLYDFYNIIDSSKDSIMDKIQNYYFDKIKKHGKESLTKKELEILQSATMGKLKTETPVYRRNKVTGDIDLDKSGNPIRIDQEIVPPGVPFVTSKGKMADRSDKPMIYARCYWNVDEPVKSYFVFSNKSKTPENPNGLIIWKTISKNVAEKPFGTFIVPKGEAQLSPEELWANLNDKFDKGVVLDKETYMKFIVFDDIYHNSKKANAAQLRELYDYLSRYPRK